MANDKNLRRTPVGSNALKAYEEEEERRIGDKNTEVVTREKQRANIRKADKPLVLGSSKNVDVGTGRGTTTFGGDKTFKQAFADARKAGKGQFTWNGKKYTTEMAGGTKSKEDFPAVSGRNRDNVSAGGGSAANIDTKRNIPTKNTEPRNTEEDEINSLGSKIRFESTRVPLEETPAAKKQSDKFEDPSSTPFWDRFKKGGKVKKNNSSAKKYASGGSVSRRGDGCAQRGKTKGRMV